MSAPPSLTGLNDGQRLGFIRQQVEVWRTYALQFRPALDGSSLAADDALFPLLPPSHLIWDGISSAVDHLDMFMGALDAGISHPLAPNTLARAGVLGAAHALWLLEGPNRPERQRRGLKLAHENFRQDLKFIAVLDAMDPAAFSDAAAIHQAIHTRKQWIQETITAGATLGLGPNQTAAPINDTDVIDTVANSYAAAYPGSDDLVTVYGVLWRMQSGNAHALRWSSMYRTKIVPGATRGTGLLTNGLPELSMAAAAVHLFTARAIDRYEKRRQPHAG